MTEEREYMTNQESSVELKACKVCEEPTTAVCNINFKAVPICDGCATSIACQQVRWWANGGIHGEG